MRDYIQSDGAKNERQTENAEHLQCAEDIDSEWTHIYLNIHEESPTGVVYFTSVLTAGYLKAIWQDFPLATIRP